MDKLQPSNEPYGKIRQSEERLLALMKATSDVIYRMSPDWKTMYELYGRGYLEDTPDPDPEWLDKYIHPQDQAFVLSVIDECIHDKRTFELEHRVLQADGSLGWTFSCAIPLLDGKGEIREWFGAANDITERRRMEEALREKTKQLEEANRRLGDVLESISDTFYAVDSKWRFTYVCHKAEECWHRSREELLGKVLWDMFPEPEKTVGWKMHHEVMDTRRPLHWETFSPNLKTWIEASAYPSADGGISVYFRDITERRKAEETLSLQANILQSVHDAIFVSDGNYIITYWNGMAEKMFGWTAEEAIGKHSGDLLKTKVPGSSGGAGVEKMLEDNYYKGEVIYRHKDGSEIYTVVHANVLRDNDGKATQIILSFRDITVQKKAEKERDRLFSEAEDQQRYLRSIFEQLPVGVAVFDKNGKPLLTNEKMDLYMPRKIPSNDPLEAKQWRALDQQGNEIPPDQWPGARALRGDTVVPGIELTYTERAGHERWISVSAAPLLSEEGEIIGGASVAEDITKRKRAEEALRFQANILRIVDDAVIAFDPSQHITYWSPGARKMYGWTEEEALGKTPSEILRPLQYETETSHAKEARIDAFNRGELVQGENIQRRKDGSEFWVEYNSQAYFDNKGILAGFVTMHRDITERKKAVEQLRLHSSIAESLGEAILAVDPNQKVIFWNKGAETLYFWREEEAVGRNLTQLFTPVYYEGGVSREEAVQAYLEKGWWRGEARYQRKDGSVIDVMANGRMMKDQNGKITSMFIIHTDITERKKMEEALREKTKQLEEANRQKEDILESISDCFYALDKDLHFTYVNKAAEEIWGMLRTDLLGRKIDDVFPGLIDISLSKFFRALQDQESQHYEVYSKVALKWGDMSVYPTRDGISVYFHDITDRKLAEEALRESEEKYRLLFDSIDEGFCIIEVIFDGNMNPFDYRFLEVNKSFERQTGLVDAKGRLMRDMAPEHEQHWFDIYGRIALTGKPERFQNPAKALGFFYDVYAFSVGKPEQRRVAILFNDITERKKAEEVLRKSEAQLTEFSQKLTAEVDALNIFHKINTRFIKEDDARLVYADILDAVILLTDADCGNMQIVAEDGNTLEIVAHKGYSDEFIHRYQRVTDGSTICYRVKEQKLRIIADDVSSYPILDEDNRRFMLGEGMVCIQSTPMVSVSGKLLGIMSTHYKSPHVFDERQLRVLDLLSRQAANVIERIKIGEALRESEKKALELVEVLKETDSNKNQFISALSHELRNPLAVISTGLEILGLTQDKEQIRKTNDIIRRQMRQLCALVDDLLDLTRISNNRIELKKEVLELSSLVLSTAEEQRALFDEKGVGLHTRICDDPIFIDADTVRIKQIIGNLLHNAQKYTQAGGEVFIRVFKENREAVISVKDNGLGLSPELIPRLFQPFVQADMTLDRSGGGLGLGLSITKGIAEMHGGSIVAYSRGLGQGSEFVIRLPLDGTGAAAG